MKPPAFEKIRIDLPCEYGIHFLESEQYIVKKEYN